MWRKTVISNKVAKHLMPFGALKQVQRERLSDDRHRREVAKHLMPFGRVGGVRTYYALTAKKRNKSFDSLRLSWVTPRAVWQRQIGLDSTAQIWVNLRELRLR
jgi:hypothetical protein